VTVLNELLTHPPTRSLTAPPLALSLIHSLSHSPDHSHVKPLISAHVSLTHPLTHLLTHLLIHSPTHHFSHSPTDSYASTLTHPLTGQPTCSFFHLQTHVILKTSAPYVVTGIQRGFHYMLGHSLLDKLRAHEICCILKQFPPKCPDRLFGARSLRFDVYYVSFPRVNGWGVTLTTPLHLVTKTRMSDAMFAALSLGCHDMETDNFTCLFYLITSTCFAMCFEQTN
jgi:hypothetical protein